MASLSLSLSLSSTPTHPFPPSFSRRLTTKPPPSSSNAAAIPDDKPNALTVPERSQTQRKVMIDIEKLKKREAKERKEEVNSKIASRKAISIILRREATKALIEKKRGPTNSKKLLPRTVLEALHERIKALRPDSALKFTLFPSYILCNQMELDIMLHSQSSNLFFLLPKRFSEMESTLSAGVQPNIRTFNILLDSYGKAGEYEKMSAVMEYMQKYHNSWTIVTYNVVIDAFGKAGDLKQMEYLFRLMRSERSKPSCVTLCSLVRAYGQAGKPEKIGGVLHVVLDTVFFNCLVDAYGRMGCFAEMKGVLDMMEQKDVSLIRLHIEP
ncbi:pentatricopeptide repeat-containing protein [Quercus suber]|uniref:Pentatricopeptide repeat-containing protein n=1 Tax=Quercus suber TaxID=58331 RepID=A0AAW0LUI8_QUESU